MTPAKPKLTPKLSKDAQRIVNTLRRHARKMLEVHGEFGYDYFCFLTVEINRILKRIRMEADHADE